MLSAQLQPFQASMRSSAIAIQEFHNAPGKSNAVHRWMIVIKWTHIYHSGGSISSTCRIHTVENYKRYIYMYIYIYVLMCLGTEQSDHLQDQAYLLLVWEINICYIFLLLVRLCYVYNDITIIYPPPIVSFVIFRWFLYLQRQTINLVYIMGARSWSTTVFYKFI